MKLSVSACHTPAPAVQEACPLEFWHNQNNMPPWLCAITSPCKARPSMSLGTALLLPLPSALLLEITDAAGIGALGACSQTCRDWRDTLRVDSSRRCLALSAATAPLPHPILRFPMLQHLQLTHSGDYAAPQLLTPAAVSQLCK